MPNVELTHTVTDKDIAEWCDEDPKLIELILFALGPAALQRAITLVAGLIEDDDIAMVQCPRCGKMTWAGLHRCMNCSSPMALEPDNIWSAKDELRKVFKDEPSS